MSNPTPDLFKDAVFLANSDHPGAQLGSVQFDGFGFADWSHSVRRALGAKFKLGFIDGTCVRPKEDGEDLSRWIRTDYMIRCWIINSMSKGIASGFRHISSALELWTELQESCASRAACNCELPKHLAASDNKNRVLSFVQQLETQKYVSSISSHVSSLYVGGASHDKTKGDGNKSSLICNYCKTFGHIVEKFYKLIGISAEFLVYFPAHKMFVKMSPWSNEVVDSICGLPFVLACFMKSSTDSFVCMAENWVFDPGGF